MKNSINTNSANLVLQNLVVLLGSTLGITVTTISQWNYRVAVKVFRKNSSNTGTTYDFEKNDEGVWEVDIPASEFTSLDIDSHNCRYRIFYVDNDGKRFYCGEGAIEVKRGM